MDVMKLYDRPIIKVGGLHMQKRFWCVMLIMLAFGVFFVTGCNKKNAIVEISKDEFKEPYQIDWYYISPNTQTDIGTVEEAVNEYLKDKLNVTLKLNGFSWNPYEEKMKVMIAGGEKFDICFTSAGVLNYKMNVLRNAFLPINDLMDQYAPKTKGMLDENFLKGSQIAGKNYAIPALKDSGHNYGFLYRKDLAEKYNLVSALQGIKSFEELEPIFKVIKANEPDIIPFDCSPGHSITTCLDFDMIAFPGGFYPDTIDNKVVNVVETPEYANAVKLVNKYYQEGFIGNLNAEKSNYFINIEQLKPGKDKEISSAKPYEYVQVDLTPPRMMSCDTMGSMLAISSTSKNPKRVMRFLELLNTDPYLNNLIVYGIEGKHYRKVSEDKIEVNKNGGYTYASYQWMFGNTFLNYLTTKDDPEKKKKMWSYNKIVKPSKVLGFHFDIEPVKSQVAACDNVRIEYIKTLEKGSVDADIMLPKFIEKLKKAGADQITDEIKKQHDQWLRSQK